MDIYAVYIDGYGGKEDERFFYSEDGARRYFDELAKDHCTTSEVSDITFENCHDNKYTAALSTCPKWEFINPTY